MNESILITASRLSDDALLARVPLHVGREREASGDAAYNRVAAARAVRQFPVILDHLAAGFVTVTTVKVLRPVLTTQNHLAVLAEAKYRSKTEVERIVARLDPKPDVPSTIRKLPTPAPVAAAPVSPVPLLGDATPPAAILQVAPVNRPVIAPLTPERFRVQFTVSKETHDKLRRVQDLLCREIPGGDPAAIFDNISLRCRAHNVYESELVFGRFDPSVVGETPENYVTSREIAPFQNGGSSDAPPVLP